MVARWGSAHPAVPLVVLLHGNGTSEHSMIEIAPWLPHGPVAYVAVRAPLPAERGFRWFAEIDGRPDPNELAGATRFVLRWLDGEGDRPVLLLAFRGGVTLAGSLLLAAPERFSGAVLLHGALPLDPLPPRGALRGMPVLLAYAEDDPRTPQPLLAATRDWLRRWSGAPIRLEQAPGGRLAGSVVDAAGSWLADAAGPPAPARREPATRRSRAGLAGPRPASETGRRAARHHRWAPSAAALVQPGPGPLGPDRRPRYPSGRDHRPARHPFPAAPRRRGSAGSVPAWERVRPPALRRQPAPLPAPGSGLRRSGQGLGARPPAGRRPAECGPGPGPGPAQRNGA